MKFDRNINDEKVIAKKQAEPTNIKKEIFSSLSTILFTVIIVSAVILLAFRITPVDGSSMVPTLRNADQLITTNINFGYKRGDIVVIRRSDDTALVKRVIAVEGDTIDIDFELHEVYVNGKTINEPYINEPTELAIDFDGQQVVPKGHVFVMGDNRNHSDDSRDSEIGMIDVRNIFGKAIFRLFPINRFGPIE